MKKSRLSFNKETVQQPEQGSILDFRRAQRSLNEISQLLTKDAYFFQPEHEKLVGAEATVNGDLYTVFSSYDYIGLIGHEKINEAAVSAIDRYGTGTGGVRILTGTNSLHIELEQRIASFLGKEVSITFSSGYVANLAVTTSIIGRNGKVLVDEKIHRSFVDALNLAGSDYEFFKHNDTDDLKAKLEKYSSSKRKYIISEGIFSMDGDICPLKELIELKKQFAAYLIIDEAHSFGVLGTAGKGVGEYHDIDPNDVDLITGSLSKAIPANGGFVAGRKNVILFMQHEAAPFVFSSALSPVSVGASLEALNVIQNEKWRFDVLAKNTKRLKQIVSKHGFEIDDSPSPIVPLLTRDYERTFEFTKSLYERSILVSPVIFPAVPPDRSLIRLCATVNHTEEMLNELNKALEYIVHKSDSDAK